MRAMTIDAIISAAGGVGKLAEILGVSHSSVCDWRRAERIPVARALVIHESLAIPLHEIRPDVWRSPKRAA